MKGSLAVFGEINGRSAAARLVDGRLEDLLVDAPVGRIVPGTIYRARATRPMKGQGGMILDSPDGPLFLRGAKGLAAGDTLFVQTTSYAEAGKATPCSARLTLKSRFSLVTPGAVGKNISKSIRDEDRRVELRELLDNITVSEGIGLVLRTAAAGADDAAITEDIEALSVVANALVSDARIGPPEKLFEGASAQETALRDWPLPDSTETGKTAFDDLEITDVIQDLQSGREDISGGGFFFVEPTRALVSVDVNTGGDTSPASGLKASIEALRALPRALRLRGLGGQITVDLAPVAKKDRKQIESVIRSAFRTDPVETTFVGWTPLGHVELIRKRERLPLTECLR